jgi:hypothetical protein
MTTAIIPFVITGAAVVMLIGGLVILGHAFKTWKEERDGRK